MRLCPVASFLQESLLLDFALWQSDNRRCRLIVAQRAIVRQFFSLSIRSACWKQICESPIPTAQNSAATRIAPLWSSWLHCRTVIITRPVQSRSSNQPNARHRKMYITPPGIVRRTVLFHGEFL